MNRPFELTADAEEKLIAVAELESYNFSDLVRVSGLRKNRDFRGANLSQVDFTGSDLRGFDFTDADLSRTYGHSFIIDSSTILDGANVESSILAYEKTRRDYFERNATHYQLFKRLKGEYWSTGAVWIGENLRSTSKNYEASAQIAKYLYSSVKDVTYKNQILYGIRKTFKTPLEYKQFLLDQVIDPDLSHRSLRVIIDILARSFKTDQTVVRIISTFLGHRDSEVRQLCIPPVMRRSFFEKHRETIIHHMKVENDEGLRKLYTQSYLKNSRLIDDDLLKVDAEMKFLDYQAPIGKQEVLRIVRAYCIRRKFENAVRHYVPDEVSIHVSLEDQAEALLLIDTQLTEAVDDGLPLQLEYDLEAIYNESFNKTSSRRQVEHVFRADA
jgi:hypothetical protein